MCLCRSWCKTVSRKKYKSGYKSPFFREKLLWRQSIPMSISHPPPRNATNPPKNSSLLHMSLNHLQSICTSFLFLEIHLQWINFVWFFLFNFFANYHKFWNWCYHQKCPHNLWSQTFGIFDCNQVGSASNCLWRESAPFDQFQNQFWPVHSIPSPQRDLEVVSSVLWCHCACLRSAPVCTGVDLHCYSLSYNGV